MYVTSLLINIHQVLSPTQIISKSDPQSIIFDESCIRTAAMLTDGAAGPSGVDAQAWRKLCTSFGAASGDLCRSLAAAARRLCTCFVDPRSISAFLACRLIALSKNPGVCPIGIGEAIRRIIAKAILSITKHDIEDAVGSLQFCA